jgi:hypothetical protein
LGITSNNPEFTENFGSGTQNQHIYITNDEDIKEGDWVIQINFEKTNTQIIKCQTESQTIIANSKNGSFIKNKIILTTDQDLIKDGVQAIDDDFLEWFVKNPSCEEVETFIFGFDDSIICHSKKYEIIIPKEEIKTKCYCGHTTTCDCGPEEPKKETLEEVAERKFQNIGDRLIFEDGAKWQQKTYNQFTLSMDDLKSSREGYLKAKEEYELKQQERSYSEEEVLNKLTHFAVEIQRQNKEGVFPLRIK